MAGLDLGENRGGAELHSLSRKPAFCYPVSGRIPVVTLLVCPASRSDEQSTSSECMKNTALCIGAVSSIVFLSVSLRGEPTAAQVSRLSDQPSCDLVAFEEGLDRLPHDRWVILHVQDPDDQVIFSRQWHGGSAFDSKRGRLILLGSDTHGNEATGKCRTSRTDTASQMCKR